MSSSSPAMCRMWPPSRLRSRWWYRTTWLHSCAACPESPRLSPIAESDPPHDIAAALLSLPLILGTDLNTVPADVPYLHPQADRLDYWRQRIGPRSRPRVGLCWRGSQHIPERSMPLADLTPLLSRRDVELHAIQIEIPDSDRACIAANPAVTLHEAALTDFAETAALLWLMDLVISVDTSVAHLAGALGRPTWIMLRRTPDWRWLLGRQDSPWYPRYGCSARTGAAAGPQSSMPCTAPLQTVSATRDDAAALSVPSMLVQQDYSMKSALFAILAAGFLTAVQPSPGFAGELPVSWSDVARSVLPGVVSISVEKIVHDGTNRGEGRREMFYGSGFIIDPAGTIVTNRHVIDGAVWITVSFADRSQAQRISHCGLWSDGSRRCQSGCRPASAVPDIRRQRPSADWRSRAGRWQSPRPWDVGQWRHRQCAEP